MIINYVESRLTILATYTYTMNHMAAGKWHKADQSHFSELMMNFRTDFGLAMHSTVCMHIYICIKYIAIIMYVYECVRVTGFSENPPLTRSHVQFFELIAL